jgi:nitroreductase
MRSAVTVNQAALDNILARRSVRSYTDRAVDETAVDTLLRAAMAAPSGSNARPWHFVVVTERTRLQRLTAAHQHAGMLGQAALAIVVCGDAEISPRHWVEDCAAATQNILLAATALGLGSCWVAMYPEESRAAACRASCAIPESMRVLCAVALGHPVEPLPARTQYDENRVHREHW